MDRHMILTRGRSGSNFLTNTLNLHPQVTNYGEVLGDWTITYKFYRRLRLFRETSVDNYLDYVFSSRVFFYAGQLYSLKERIRKRQRTNVKRWGRIRNIGIKDFVQHFAERGALGFIQTNPDVAIIRLYRENILRRHLSEQFLIRTGIALTDKQPQQDRGKITVDLEVMMEVLDRFAGYLREEETLLRGLPNHRILEIKFEDLFAGPDSLSRHNREVFEFLGVQPIAEKSQQKKMSPKLISDMVANYDQLRERLRDTPYQQFLD